MSGKVKCTCGWSWNKSDSSKKDMYICHECGRDNSNNMRNGGWLDNYGEEDNYNDYNVSAPEGFEGDGYSNVGRNSSPAWGGQFQLGGSVYPVNYVPEAQMGTSMPGAVGFTYARTGSIPSNGKYAKKTLPSAQIGKDVRKPGQAIKLSGMSNVGEVNYAPYVPTLEGLNKAKTKIEKQATKEFINWYSDPATKEKFKKNTGLDPKRMQDLIGKGLNTPMSEYDTRKQHDWPMAANADAAYKSAWLSQQQKDPTAPKTGYISYTPQGADIPEVNIYSRPLKDIIGHEIAHASGFDVTLAPALYRALGLKLPTKTEIPDLAYPSKYMQRPEEVYGNFHELRLNLGLTPGEKIDRESLKKRVKADPHTSKNFWDYYSKDPKTGKEDDKKIDKIVNAINTVAQVENIQQDPAIQTAQNGKEMQYYQQGLDWQPKTISRDGSQLDKAQPGTNLPSVRDLITDTMNRKIQAHKGKGKETAITKKDNTKTVTPKEVKKLSAKQQNELAQRQSEEQARKDWVQGSMEEAYKSPLMSPGYFTPEGVAIGVLQGATKMGPDLYEGNYKGAAMDALMMLPLAPSAIKTATPLIQKAGRALGTKEGLLSNAYKYNPRAFKPQQGKIYRQVGKPGFDDALIEGKVYDKGQKQFLENNPNINYLDEYNDAVNAKGLYLRKPSSAPFFSKDELFFPIDRKATGKGFKKTANSDAEYLIEGSVPDEALLPRYMDKYLKPGEKTSTFVLRPEYNNLENFKTYKRDWLQGYKEVPKQEDGGIIKDDRGQWDHPGEITEIGSNDITMEGVPYDVLGISDTGDTKLMKPGKNYKFKGKKVTEYPMAKNGVNQQDQKTFEQLDQLTNFTNYNKPTIGGWLNKYN